MHSKGISIFTAVDVILIYTKTTTIGSDFKQLQVLNFYILPQLFFILKFLSIKEK